MLIEPDFGNHFLGVNTKCKTQKNDKKNEAGDKEELLGEKMSLGGAADTPIVDTPSPDLLLL